MRFLLTSATALHTSALLVSIGVALTGCASKGAHGADAFVRAAFISAAGNLDFEGGAEANGFPAQWSGGGPGYAITVDHSQAHGGKGAASLAWSMPAAPIEDDWCTLTQCVDIEAWRGKRIRYTGFLKTAGVKEGAGIWMRVDHDKKTVAFDNMLDRGAKGTTDWRSYSVVLDVAQDATRACFGVVMVGPGTVWADDLKFEVVGMDVPVTDIGGKASK